MTSGHLLSLKSPRSSILSRTLIRLAGGLTTLAPCKVETRSFESLDDHIAQVENLADAAALRATLGRFYTLEKDSELVVVHFKLVRDLVAAVEAHHHPQY